MKHGEYLMLFYALAVYYTYAWIFTQTDESTEIKYFRPWRVKRNES